jgi:exodeoxyribonuclease VII large subunit
MITVSELNEKVKAVLESTFMHIMVEGEVGSATYHSSGHLYFNIKDDKSSIKCVMWRSNVKKLKFKIESGEHIVIDGSIGVYSPRGEYQLIAVNIEPYGKGALAVAFEQLKKKLEAKGYFDKEHKKALPKFPKKVAVVTALKSAALQDILKVAKSRWALAEFVIIDTLVQGDSASLEIARGIKYADTLGADVILVSRGGGSQEDLWAFNEEIVADAIFNAKTPVVSAVGHEVDFLTSDFVADLRAPTPSAAIEIILPDFNEYLFYLDDLADKFNSIIEQKISQQRQNLYHLQERLKSLSPKEKLNFYIQEFKSSKKSLHDIMDHKLLMYQNLLEPLKSRAQSNMSLILRKKEGQLKLISEQLSLNNPKNRVKSGFVELTKNGKRVELCKVKEGEKLTLVNSKCKVEVSAVKNPSTF